MESRPPARRWGRAAVGLLAGLALVVVPGVGAGADTPDEEPSSAESLGLSAEIGFDGRTIPLAAAPVTVTVRPDRPVRGVLTLTSTSDTGGGALAQELPVEVGAGVEKRFHLLLPAASSARVALLEDGAEEPTVVDAVRRQADGFLVGTLGTAADRVPDVLLEQTGDRAVPVSLPSAVLDLGPDALDPLSVVVVRQEDLRDLDPAARRTIAGAVASGLHLLVTEADDPDLGLPWRPAVAVTGGAVEAAPAAWSTSTVGEDGDTPQVAAVRAGRGRVATTVLALDDPALDPVLPHVLQPSRLAGASALGFDTIDVASQSPELFRSATGDAPGLGWIAVFLVAYLLIVGPVAGFLLHRRRRPELAWVVVPTVTALFAGAAFLGAVGSRPRVGIAGAAEAWVDGVGTEVVAGVVRSPTSGTHTIDLVGAGWSVQPAGWETSAAARTVGDAVQARVRLLAQSTGGVVATRPAPGEAPLLVEAAVVDGVLQVEVANVGDRDLRRVRVEIASLARTVAEDLPAGETVTEQLELPEDLPGLDQPFDDPRWRLLDGRRTDASALRILLGDHVDTTRPGIVWVTAIAGTGAATEGTVTIDGSVPLDHGGYVAVGVTPTTTDDATHPTEVLGDVVLRAGAGAWRDGATVVSSESAIPVRLHLPAEGRATSIRLSAFEAFMGDARGFVEPLPQPGFACPPDAISCEFDEFGGEVCFPDGTCEAFEQGSRDEPVAVDPLPNRPVGPGGSVIALWDHVESAWVDLAEDDADALTDLDRWVSPLGDLWLRAQGGFVQLDLARVSAAVELDAVRRVDGGEDAT